MGESEEVSARNTGQHNLDCMGLFLMRMVKVGRVKEVLVYEAKVPGLSPNTYGLQESGHC